ncbi:MAG TPA: biopolymer transporter ExbD [Synergistaceae bacterium]|jgi:biopolymer transport protein ExbD|nr:MAG: Biopolymer transport protein [Synergistales bacterium 53_16]KUL05461.1 MAG: Biopolymer transport protein [Synergistales bacterium 54_9]MDK2845552.1 biopolymer transport protein TolR [Synergistales bacterium]HAA47112.1 biopolymer transporter ExbD [Synergistaceae bacterium]MDN5335319.1 biopolymer transport protein TolR [Synergistales bacterium]
MKKRRYSTEIELTPLIDVLFMLIVFFVLTTSFIASGIRVDLPAAKGSPVEGSPLVITITKEGNVFFEGSRMSPNDIASALEHAVGDRLVLIKADKESAYGVVVELLDALGKVGVNHLDLAVEDVRTQ